MQIPNDNQTPPSDIEAEQLLINNCTLRPALIDEMRAIVKERDFYREAHGPIWSTLCEMRDRNRKIDGFSLRQELRKRKLDADYTNALLSKPLFGDTNTAAKVVAGNSLRRRLADTANEILVLSNSRELDESEILDNAERAIMAVRTVESSGKLIRIYEPMIELTNDLESRTMSPGRLRGISTGFTALDRYSCGLPPELILIGARPSMGKSALCYSLAMKVAGQGKSVALFSLDASIAEVLERILSMESMVQGWGMKTGRLSADEWERLNSFSIPIAGLPIYINDSMEGGVETIASECRRLNREPLGMIIVDYIQLLQTKTNTRGLNRTNELAVVSRALKALSREFNVPVLALSQLSRDCEKRENKRPLMSDLRDSGSIEAEAGQVWLLYREAYYKNRGGESDADGARARPNSGVQEETEIIIGKNKNGPTGWCKVGFIPEYARFVELGEHGDMSDF